MNERRNNWRRQMPTGGASMPPAAVMPEETMMAAVSFGAGAKSQFKAQPGQGKRSG